MSPQILYIIITSFIGAFKEYTAVVGLFDGPGTVKGDYSMETIVYYIYDNLSSSYGLGCGWRRLPLCHHLDLHLPCSFGSRRNGSTIEEEKAYEH
jgi:hypothetical protein